MKIKLDLINIVFGRRFQRLEFIAIHAFEINHVELVVQGDNRIRSARDYFLRRDFYFRGPDHSQAEKAIKDMHLDIIAMVKHSQDISCHFLPRHVFEFKEYRPLALPSISDVKMMLFFISFPVQEKLINEFFKHDEL